MQVRSYCTEAESTGRDEGGFFRMKTVPELSAELKRRMERCAGCHNDFYNRRSNSGGKNTCYSLERDSNFRGRGRPECFRR